MGHNKQSGRATRRQVDRRDISRVWRPLVSDEEAIAMRDAFAARVRALVEHYESLPGAKPDPVQTLCRQIRDDFRKNAARPDGASDGDSSARAELADA